MDTYINILGDLTYLKQMNIKPNFSDLSRKYHINRHTIAKYYKNGGKIIKKCNPLLSNSLSSSFK